MRYLSILTFLFSIAVINPAHAGVLIELDLSVTNKLTLTATTGTALASTTGNTGVGIILEGTGTVLSGSEAETGDTFGFYNQASPVLFYQAETARILNAAGVNSINLYEKDFNKGATTSIYQGEQAFVGSTTIALDKESYDELLKAPSSGKIYAFADNPSYADETHIGDWAKASSGNVPEPSTAIAMGLLGVVGFAGNRRRRRSATV